ncbi:ROK family protein [Herbiconiux sp. YIM B11900]|uniref:ROK family protein n=1 Tax=Herbiconiux sp. YIM B11900 TaxID=3404131 RepID=UPI003F843347
MVQDIRELNRSAVLTALMIQRPATRKQIAESTGISAATVTRAIDQLIVDGIVSEVSEVVVEKRGRRAILLDLVAARALVIGVDLGASSTRIIASDLLATPLVAIEIPTPADLGAAELALWLAEQAKAAMGDRWDAVAGVSLGLPGAVNQGERSVSNAPNLRQVEDPAFLTVCELALGLPLHADNDANLALLGELRFGAARHTPYAAMLSLGAGLGVGIAIDGAILRGRHGLVGEFGQIPVGAHGERLESFTTGPALMARAATAGVRLESPATLFAEPAAGTDAATGRATAELRADFDRALVTALTAIAVSSEPETIVLGGGIAKSLTADLGAYQKRLEQTIRIAPTLTRAELGDFSGAAGGLVVALHAIYLSLGVDPAALATLPQSTALTPERIVQIAAI